MKNIMIAVCALFLLGCMDSSTQTTPPVDDSLLQDVVLEETYQQRSELITLDESDLRPSNPRRLETLEAQIGGQTFTLEVSKDQAEREMGLMHREAMQYDEGMLFIFDEAVRHRFWMMNTLIPLDMLWLNENREITHFETATPCYEEPCAIYGDDSGNSKYVIELPAGSFVEEIGTVVEF